MRTELLDLGAGVLRVAVRLDAVLGQHQPRELGRHVQLGREQLDHRGAKGRAVVDRGVEGVAQLVDQQAAPGQPRGDKPPTVTALAEQGKRFSVA